VRPASANRKWALLLSLVLLTGYAAFYIAVERSVFAYRYRALEEVQAVARTFPRVPLGSYKSVDMRAVYYYGRPIPVLSRADIVAAATSPQPQFVLIERETLASEKSI